MINMRIDIPPDVLSLMERLRQADYESFLVGGCVRDALLNKQPTDYDIATDATPDAMKRVFSTEPLLFYGAKHGTVAVVTDARVVEMTTYRVDGAYSDARRPDTVCFTRSLAQDLLRRDFTVNALAYNPDGGLVDEVGGFSDLNLRVVRSVGEPGKRYGEDALRILRALRFSSALNFEIERETFEAALIMRSALRKISRERIQSELVKLLLGEGAGEVILSGRAIIEACLDGFHNLPADAYREMCAALGGMPVRAEARLAAFFLPLGYEGARREMAGLRFSGETTSGALKRIELFACDLSAPLELQRALGRYDLLAVLDALLLHAAHGADTRELRERAQSLVASGACLTLKQLAVDGRDVIALGVEPGRKVGQILSALLSGVIAGEVENERAALLGAIRTFL